MFQTKDQEKEWHQISPQQPGKLADNGALPWKHKHNVDNKTKMKLTAET